MKCPNCHFENPNQFKFCGECGTRIVDIIPASFSADKKQDFSAEGLSDFHSTDPERRHITVMFCDLVGSTHLSEHLDPEDFRQLLHVYQDTCVYAVNQFEGHLAQYLGDGVLIYFGYPGAHADDTQRAIRCGLEIINELQHLNELQTQFPGIKLSVRIGIHTGLVVVGEISRDKNYGRLALGNTPNIAARLQALADPDSIIISSTTYRSVREFFECQPLGTYSLKGVSHKINIFKVIKALDFSYSFKTYHSPGATSFVGRESEIQQLIQNWSEVKKDRGRVVHIIGEPGIGKTRILRSFEERIKDEPHTWLVFQCISYYKNSAFYPIINLINSRLKISKNDKNKEKLKKLEEALAGMSFDLDETVPIMASLLSIPISKPYHSLSLTPEKQREKTIQILLDWLLKASKRNPLLFVIEDVQWADSSTLEHLTLLMEKVDRARILIILTFHPRFHPPTSKKSRLSEIFLNRLSRQQTEHMVKEVTGGKIFPSDVIDLLLIKTDGIPLFVEELTKMLVDSEFLVKRKDQYEIKESLLKPAIPETLQDTLMARLDQLGAVKEVVQLAAVVGREFSFELIRAMTSIDEKLLKEELKSLVEADILEMKEDTKHKIYVFRQVLIQDAAYNSILKSKRENLHKKIAAVLVKQFKDYAESHPQVIAYHYSRASDYKHAIEYHLKSGKLLIEQSAHNEAISQLNKGIDLLKYIDAVEIKYQLELDLKMMLGIPLLATRGYGAEEVGAIYERASELSQMIGNIPKLFPALVGQYRFYLIRGDLPKALDISELLLSWAQTSHKSDLLLEAARAVGVTLFHMGDITKSLEQLEISIGLYDSVQNESHAYTYGTDPAVTCLSYAALAQCLLGYNKKALSYGQKAIQITKKLDHPFSRVFALNHHSWLHQYYKNVEQVDKYSSELVNVSDKYGFRFWWITGMFFQGWVLTYKGKGKIKDGIEQMERCISSFQETGAGSVLPYFMTSLAEILNKNKMEEKSLNWLELAERSAQKNREHFFDAETYRVKAEVILKLNRDDKKNAESFLWRSIEISRRQKLKSLELRALLSLVTIGENKKEILKLLRETYDWFKDGHETEDLLKAKKLL